MVIDGLKVLSSVKRKDLNIQMQVVSIDKIDNATGNKNVWRQFVLVLKIVLQNILTFSIDFVYFFNRLLF